METHTPCVSSTQTLSTLFFSGNHKCHPSSEAARSQDTWDGFAELLRSHTSSGALNKFYAHAALRICIGVRACDRLGRLKLSIYVTFTCMDSLTKFPLHIGTQIHTLQSDSHLCTIMTYDLSIDTSRLSWGPVAYPAWATGCSLPDWHAGRGAPEMECHLTKLKSRKALGSTALLFRGSLHATLHPCSHGSLPQLPRPDAPKHDHTWSVTNLICINSLLCSPSLLLPAPLKKISSVDSHSIRYKGLSTWCVQSTPHLLWTLCLKVCACHLCFSNILHEALHKSMQK